MKNKFTSSLKGIRSGVSILFILVAFNMSSFAQGVCNAKFNTKSSKGQPSILLFSASHNPPGSRYSWSFGDGSTSDSLNPQHTYSANGTYFVCLTVSDTISGNSICSDTQCDSVRIQGMPQANCNAHFNFQQVNDSLDVKFTAASKGPGISYSWNFGNGTDTGSSPTHYYTSAGTYNVCLTVRDSAGCTATQCDSVHIRPLPPPPPPHCDAHFTIQQAKDSLNVQFKVGGNNAGASYSWNFGDGNTSDSLSPNHSYANAGTYFVCLTVKDSAAGSGSCSDTQCDSVRINPLPPPPPPHCDAHFSAQQSNDSLNVQFKVAGNNSPAAYSWNFGDGATSDSLSPNHTYTNTGTYFVCLAVRDSVAGTGSCSDTQCDSVRIHALPPPPPPHCDAHFGIQQGKDSLNVQFKTAGNNSRATYSWNFGDGADTTGSSPTHTYARAGTYFVCLTVRDSAVGKGSCSDTRCDSIMVGEQQQHKSMCNAQFHIINDPANPRTFAFATKPSKRGTTYSWTLGDDYTSTSSAFIHTYADTGVYPVCLTVTDSAGGQLVCTDTKCDSVHVTSFSQKFCNAQFNFRSDTALYGLMFTAVAHNPGIKYSWNFGDHDTASSQNPAHTYSAAGTYEVCLTVTDSSVCSQTYCDSVKVTASRPRRIGDIYTAPVTALIYPNPFSENAVLEISNATGKVTFKVYEKTGRLVMMESFANGSYEINRKNLASGLYFYEITDDNANVKRGTLMIQ